MSNIYEVGKYLLTNKSFCQASQKIFRKYALLTLLLFSSAFYWGDQSILLR